MTARAVRYSYSLTPATGLAAALLLHGAPAAAQTQSRFSADVNTDVGASNNPFLLSGEDARSSAFAEFSVVPRYVGLSLYGRTLVEARFRRTEYLKDIGDTEEYGLSASTQQQLDPTANLAVGVSFNSSIAGERGSRLPPPPIEPQIPEGFDGEVAPQVDLPEPDLPELEVPLDPDVSVTGFRLRRELLATNASIGKQVSERDQLTIGISASRSRFPGRSFASDFWNYGVSASFSRTFSARTSGGVQISAQRSDFDTPGLSSTIYGAQLFASVQLNSSWRLQGGAGVQIVLPEDSGTTQASLSGDFQACRGGFRTSLCLSGYRSSSAGGFGGVRRQSGVGASYRYRIAEYDGINASVTFARSGQSFRRVPGITADDRDYFAAEASYDKRLFDRLFTGVVARYRDLFGTGRPVSGDVSGQVFLRVKLGQLR